MKVGFDSMKTKRHRAILEIIKKNDVYTQEGLLEMLREQGFETTQATVSRDIKSLDLVKTISSDNRYKYAPRTDYSAKRYSEKFKAVFVEAVVSVDYAINTVVIKCHVGMANAACAALDTMFEDDFVGTLAGDDTIFILLRTEQSARMFVEKVNRLLNIEN